MENPPVTYICPSCGPFLERPGNFLGPKKISQSKPVEFIAAQFTPSSQTGQFYF